MKKIDPKKRAKGIAEVTALARISEAHMAKLERDPIEELRWDEVEQVSMEGLIDTVNRIIRRLNRLTHPDGH